MKRLIGYIVILIALVTAPAYGSSKGQIFQSLLSGLRFDGSTLASGKVYFYSPGTTTYKTIYLDRNKQNIALNPYTLNSNGQAELFGDGVYDIVVKTSGGATKATWEGVSLQDISTNGVSGSDYASLNEAVADIGTTPTTLTIRTVNFPVTADVTIPATLALVIEHPGSIATGPYNIVFAGTSGYIDMNTLMTHSSDYQTTLNLFAPANDRRAKLSFWSRPNATDMTLYRPLSIEAHGVADQYNDLSGEGAGLNHVTIYSIDGSGNSVKPLEWQWGSQWSSQLVMGLRHLTLGKSHPENAETSIDIAAGNSATGHNASIVFQKNATTDANNVVNAWQLYKNSTHNFELDDSIAGIRRLLVTAGGNGEWLIDPTGTGAVKIGSTANAATGTGGLAVYSGGASTLRRIKLWGDATTSYMDLIGSSDTTRWSIRNDGSDVFRLLDNGQSFSRFSLTTNGRTALNSDGTGSIDLNVDNGSGTGGVNFGDGLGNTVATIDATGNAKLVLPTYADNAAATTGALPVGKLYKTAAGAVMIRY